MNDCAPPLSQRLNAVHAEIAQAARDAGRAPADVRLLAVSKTFGPEAVAEAHAAGQRAFGENYIQEGVAKIGALRALGLDGIEWHCIGPVQSNKTRLVASHFDWVQSVDRLKIAERLGAQRPSELGRLQVCLQLNVDGGANKSGVSPAELPALAAAVAQLPGLCLRGLMCIPEPAEHPAAAQAVFEQARACFERLRGQGLDLDTLSMGMSADLGPAIAGGSSLVRVGSAIFGQRRRG